MKLFDRQPQLAQAGYSPAIASAGIPEIIFCDDVTDDVLAGLELYRQYANSGASPETVRTEWARLLAPNAIGKPIIAVGKDGDRVVGFYTLLPTQMLLGSEIVKGAKGEFHVVHPDYRRAIVGGKTPLPLALVAQAKKLAWDRGFGATFGKTRSGVFITRMTGAQPVSFKHNDYVSSFRPIRGPLGNRVPLWKQWGAITATSALRASFAAKLLIGRREGFEEIPEFRDEHVYNPSGFNLIVSRTAVSLNTRFPAARYRKFITTSFDGKPAYFVFSRPRPGAIVQLMDWATLDVDPRVFHLILREMIRDCRRGGAAMLHLPIPIEHDNPRLGLGRAGFLRVRRETTLFINCATPELSRARDEIPWYFTNSHFGYYENAQ